MNSYRRHDPYGNRVWNELKPLLAISVSDAITLTLIVWAVFTIAFSPNRRTK